ncbi:MAG: ATP-binding cassette domain-containing protein [Oleibacter sp.]|nr:ATP-binding cassette domain-containing protein [Thalassolituus sp.]
MFCLNHQTLRVDKNIILNDISLSIAQGERVALIGVSGAGKSSLLSLLCQQHPDQVALCPQDNALVDTLSVYQNIYMGALARHNNVYNLLNLIRPWPVRKAEVEHIASDLGIAQYLFTSPNNLSGGERQRVALGRALYRHKPIFIGDEPVSSIDPQQGQQLLQHVLNQHDTAIVALHSPKMALRYFTRVIALRNGKIIGDWSSNDIDVTQLHAVYLNQQVSNLVKDSAQNSTVHNDFQRIE